MVDAPTLNMTRPSVARFCVEVDLTKEFPKSVKVGKKDRPSSSGLSAKEKKMILVDVDDTTAEDQSKEASRLPDSPLQSKEPGSAPNPSAQAVEEKNRYSVLPTILEIDDEIGSDEEFIE
ncbi:OLC1v1013098C1 [Oldenlandia corymbosa var. corymbosa]|uniref:OLC1v1013098C1 n=1 Tax=Oldenlandia corymbosa var. corymbosa TaxID=529605 RepID=A0AAV1DXF8_OLDCO|nr:OLC1v1013098C1 [Oldenlandia corymbosa var. corymbosa]